MPPRNTTLCVGPPTPQPVCASIVLVPGFGKPFFAAHTLFEQQWHARTGVNAEAAGHAIIAA